MTAQRRLNRQRRRERRFHATANPRRPLTEEADAHVLLLAGLANADVMRRARQCHVSVGEAVRMRRVASYWGRG